VLSTPSCGAPSCTLLLLPSILSRCYSGWRTDYREASILHQPCQVEITERYPSSLRILSTWPQSQGLVLYRSTLLPQDTQQDPYLSGLVNNAEVVGSQQDTEVREGKAYTECSLKW
jgi:hypothetical protein